VSLDIDNRYNLTQIVVKPLYFGMLVNIIVPAVLLFICYFVHQDDPYIGVGSDNDRLLYYVFCGLAVVDAALALVLRRNALRKPMVRSERSIQDDVTAGVLKAMKLPFLLIAAISLYGFAYFWITRLFQESLILFLVSFVVFQAVRPRVGAARKIVARQEKMAKEGKFAPGGSGGFNPVDTE